MFVEKVCIEVCIKIWVKMLSAIDGCKQLMMWTNVDERYWIFKIGIISTISALLLGLKKMLYSRYSKPM